MPLYDFECPHGHRFERQCLIAERNDPVRCEGKVNQLASDEVKKKYEELHAEFPEETVVIDGLEVKEVPLDYPEGEEPEEAATIVVSVVRCQLPAELVVGTHNNPRNILDHGLGRNRDAAREGRYDPLNPNTRFMSKGRGWRK